MPITLERVIHPVGQGAFYSERFFNDDGNEIANVVYDCGSETTKSKIAINQLPNDNIDYFFLSHFHNDHFNGIEKFFNNSLKINTLIMPQISVEEAIYCLLSCKSNCKSSIQKLCRLFNNPFSLAQQVLIVEPTDAVTNPVSQIFLSEGANNNSTINIPSYTEINISGTERPIWKYVPVFDNSIDPIEVSNAVNMLKSDPLFAGQATTTGILQKFIHLLQSNYASVRHLLKKFKNSNQNDFSMMVVSVPVKDEGRLSDKTPLDMIKFEIGDAAHTGFLTTDKEPHQFKPGALFTGDISMGKAINSINSVLKQYGHLLGTYQVPHHGSQHNYISGCFPNNEIHFLSSGIRNRHKHPTAAALASLPKLFKVTEDTNTKLVIKFKI